MDGYGHTGGGSLEIQHIQGNLSWAIAHTGGVPLSPEYIQGNPHELQFIPEDAPSGEPNTYKGKFPILMDDYIFHSGADPVPLIKF